MQHWLLHGLQHLMCCSVRLWLCSVLELPWQRCQSMQLARCPQYSPRCAAAYSSREHRRTDSTCSFLCIHLFLPKTPHLSAVVRFATQSLEARSLHFFWHCVLRLTCVTQQPHPRTVHAMVERRHFLEASGAEGALVIAKEGLRRLSRLLYLYPLVKTGAGICRSCHQGGSCRAHMAC